MIKIYIIVIFIFMFCVPAFADTQTINVDTGTYTEFEINVLSAHIPVILNKKTGELWILHTADPNNQKDDVAYWTPMYYKMFGSTSLDITPDQAIESLKEQLKSKKK